jgi:hypothetical protein
MRERIIIFGKSADEKTAGCGSSSPTHMHRAFSLHFLALLLRGNPKVALGLKAKPEIRFRAEGLRDAQGHIR